MPPDASSHNFAALEPLCTRSDADVLRPFGLPLASGQWWMYCRTNEQYHRCVQSICLSSVRSLLLTPAVAEPLIGASGHFPPASDHFCELISSRSCVQLGSYLRAWTLLDILGLLLCLDHHVAFVQVTSCILLNYKTITYKFISLIWLCW